MASRVRRRAARSLATYILTDGEPFDKARFLGTLESVWGVAPEDLEADLLDVPEVPLVFMLGKILVAVMYVASPLPEHLAEELAETADDEKGAAKTACEHKGYVLINVTGPVPVKALAHVASKVTHAAASEPGVLAVMLPWAFFPKEDYLARVVPDVNCDVLPVPAWVTVSLRYDEEEAELYTNGMAAFGLPELELTGLPKSNERTAEAIALMNSLAAMIVLETRRIPLSEPVDVGGETIRRVVLTKGPGLNVEGTSYKIAPEWR